jgi:nucleoside diphosphate kinase
MIKGTTNTEALYRAKMIDSSSSLKEFSMDRKKYFKRYILGESVEDKDTQAILMGKVVETLLMEPEEFDNRFYMSSCVSAPTGLMLDFVEALYRFSKEATDEDGNILRSFEDISKDAYVESGFKIKYDAVIKKFAGSEAEIFYNEIRKVRALNLSVVTSQDVTNAEKIVEELRNNPFTRDIVNLVSSSRYSVYNQLQIEGYDVDGHEFKSMIDKVVIDYEEKTIQVYDLKCTWSVENFFEEYYLYRRAYIQAYLYYQAAHHICKTNDDCKGFKVLPSKFIVCDSTNYYSPLVYTLSGVSLAEAYDGFVYKGRNYPGVGTIIQDLKWAIDNNVWNVSRENFNNSGVVNI